jgi:hypothetical protein
MLFGDEFDADERAEVGGGDGGVIESEDRYVASNLGHRVLTAREERGKYVLPVRLKEGSYFVFNHRIRHPTIGVSSRIPKQREWQ